MSNANNTIGLRQSALAHISSLGGLPVLNAIAVKEGDLIRFPADTFGDDTFSAQSFEAAINLFSSLSDDSRKGAVLMGPGVEILDPSFANEGTIEGGEFFNRDWRVVSVRDGEVANLVLADTDGNVIETFSGALCLKGCTLNGTPTEDCIAAS